MDILIKFYLLYKLVEDNILFIYRLSKGSEKNKSC